MGGTFSCRFQTHPPQVAVTHLPCLCNCKVEWMASRCKSSGVRRSRERVGEMTFTADVLNRDLSLETESNKLRRLHKRFKSVPEDCPQFTLILFRRDHDSISHSVCDTIAFVLMVKRMIVKSELKTYCFEGNNTLDHQQFHHSRAVTGPSGGEDGEPCPKAPQAQRRAG